MAQVHACSVVQRQTSAKNAPLPNACGRMINTGRLQTAAVGRQLQLNSIRPGMLGALSYDHVDTTSSATDKVASWLLNPQQQKQYKLAQEARQKQQEQQHGSLPSPPPISGTWMHQHRMHRSAPPTRRWLPLWHPEGVFFGRWSLFMGIWDATYTSFVIPISIANVRALECTC